MDAPAITELEGQLWSSKKDACFRTIWTRTPAPIDSQVVLHLKDLSTRIYFQLGLWLHGNGELAFLLAGMSVALRKDPGI